MTVIKHYGTDHYEISSLRNNADKVNSLTLGLHEAMWMQNFYTLLPKIREGKDVQLLAHPPEDKITLVIGAGLTVKKHDQLETLVNSEAYQKGRFTIVACDAIVKTCLKLGIRPDVITGVDGSPVTRNFFSDIDSRDIAGIPTVLSIIYNPRSVSLLEKKRAQIYWFLPMWDDMRNEGPSVTRILHFLSGEEPAIQGATKAFKRPLLTFGNVGGFSWYFSNRVLNSPVTALMGLDYGYPPETNIEDTQYYKAYQNHVALSNKASEVTYKKALLSDPEAQKPEKGAVELCYRLIKNADTGTDVLVGLNWDIYRFSFLGAAGTCPNVTVNLSPESTLFGPGITTMDFDTFLEEAQ